MAVGPFIGSHATPFMLGPTVGGTVEIGEIETLAKGSIIGGDGVAPAPGVLPVGTNGQVLVAASGETLGLQWQNAVGLIPNASETVAGKVEQATRTEALTGGTVGGTGAPLFTQPDDLMVQREGGLVAPFAVFFALAAGIAVGGARGTHAIDLQTIRGAATQYAKGDYSSIVGSGNTASAEGAAAFGRSNAVSATNGVAVGAMNIVSSAYSGTFGYSNTVSGGYGSFGVGYNNVASNAGAVAVGGNNTASGVDSSAFGAHNAATANNASCFGRSNFVSAISGVALGVMNNVATVANLNFTTGVISGDPQAVSASGVGINSVAVGVGNLAPGRVNVGMGVRNSTSGGPECVAMGYWNTANSAVGGAGYGGAVAMGVRCNALGYGAGYQYGSVAMGRSCAANNAAKSIVGDSIAIGISCRSYGASYAQAWGFNCYTNGERAIAFGNSCNSTGTNSLAIGRNTSATADFSIGIGFDADVSGVAGLNIDTYRGEATADNAVCVGRSNFVNAVSGVALGVMNNVNVTGNINSTTGVIGGDPQAVNAGGVGINSTCVGVGNQTAAAALTAVAMGFKNRATNNLSSAVGQNNVATGVGSVALGNSCNATPGTATVAVGRSLTASGTRAVCFGYSSSATGVDSVAIGTASGTGNQATADNAVCVGRSNFVSAISGVALGVMNNVATVANLNDTTGVIGGDPQAANAVIGINSTAVGVVNLARGLRTTSMGFKNYAAAQDATAMGSQNTASASASTAVGFSCTASGTQSTAFGRIAKATGTRALAMGNYSRCYGQDSACIGRSNYINTGFDRASAIGYGNTAGADEAQAFGRSNFVNAVSSIAVGVCNNINVTGNLNNTTGVISGDPQVVVAAGVGINSTTVGVGNQSTSLRATAIGFKNVVSGLGSIALGQFNTASATISFAIGSSNTASGACAAAVGYRNEATADNASLFGCSNFGDAVSSMAAGVMNNVTTPGNLNDTTGVIVGDPQAVNVNGVGINSSAVGVGNQAEGLRASCFGFKCLASAADATAIGSGARARVAQTTNIAGPIIIAKDDGEIDADIWKRFAGAIVEILLDEIDLTAAPADKTISAPANCHLWIEETGVHITEKSGTITTQPTVRFGISGTPEKYVANTVTTKLTAQYKRQRYTPLLQDDGETDFLFGVSTAATGTALTLKGRPYARMRIVEDE